ncbi:MAG TPA: hypothetical protein VGJ48_27245, partial [Pyrinomonadaceae bacterium]
YPLLVLYLFSAAARFLLKIKPRRQKLWHRGSTNTERGAVATWSVTIKNELIVTGPGRYRSWFCICAALQLASR